VMEESVPFHWTLWHNGRAVFYMDTYNVVYLSNVHGMSDVVGRCIQHLLIQP
jgi:hypothetical protein